jgi:hypothetical protein
MPVQISLVLWCTDVTISNQDMRILSKSSSGLQKLRNCTTAPIRNCPLLRPDFGGSSPTFEFGIQKQQTKPNNLAARDNGMVKRRGVDLSQSQQLG